MFAAAAAGTDEILCMTSEEEEQMRFKRFESLAYSIQICGWGEGAG